MLKNIHILTIVLISVASMAFQVNFGLGKARLNEASFEVEIYKPIVVLELFTSQGCSSCPSADLLLQKVKKEYKKEVFALSYHVNYWDYIGWKDPFGKAKYVEKQREYNIKFRNGTNYTPQLVVNGKEHFVGSSTTKMYGSIDAFKERKSFNEIKLKNVSIAAENISFNYEVQGSLKNKIVRAVLVLDERVTEVKRGENRNRTLKNSNIVVAEKLTIAEAGDRVSMAIPEIVRNKDRLNLIVLVENSMHDITAAAKQSIAR